MYILIVFNLVLLILYDLNGNYIIQADRLYYFDLRIYKIEIAMNTKTISSQQISSKKNTFKNSFSYKVKGKDDQCREDPPSMSQKFQLNKLYNLDIAPEDSEKTLFYYLKTLAYQFIIVLLTILSLLIAFSIHFRVSPVLDIDNAKWTIMILTALTMLTAILQTATRIQWLKQKKQKQNSAKEQYIRLAIELMLLIPCPNTLVTGSFTIFDYRSGNIGVTLQIDHLLTAYLLGRIIYCFKFLVHSQLYYGSRPDRLSRLYTVRFGTFNAFKFLINQKPLLIVCCMFFFNVLILPMEFLLIQGGVNSSMSNFMACLHYTVVTQVTVGYGDVNVITIFGRSISIICVLIGVTSTSLLLIFFMRLMEQSSQQQQSHLLLTALQRRQEAAKARVLRIEAEYLNSKAHCTPQQKQQQEQKIRQFRFNNRRKILLQRQEPANVKRMMLSNFSAIVEMINDLKQKQTILSKIIELLMKLRRSQPQLRKQISQSDYFGTKDNQDKVKQNLKRQILRQ